MAPQNHLISNNSSNGMAFGHNTTNNNFNQGNNHPISHNSPFNSSSNPCNTQSNSFFANNQQPVINNQKSPNQNPLFTSYNNIQQTHRNSANVSPQFCYNNYQNIAN